MATTDIVEGWTGNLDFQLKSDGAVVNLTGMTVELILTDKDGAAITTAGNITVFDAANGKVRYIPDAADLDDAKSPYTARWKVTDGAGKIVFFPNGVSDVYLVRRP